MDTTAIRIKRYAAISVIALATIVVQILVSRIVSVTLYYHFAFAGITLAMLGLTGGALKVFSKPERYSAARADEMLACHAAAFARNFLFAVLIHAYLPGVLPRPLFDYLSSRNLLGDLTTIPSVLLLLFAFIDSGVCVALLLTRFPSMTGKLYAFDLCSAALGCIAVIAALAVFDPITVLIMLAAAVAVLACWLLPRAGSAALRLRVYATMLLLAGMLIVQFVSGMSGAPEFRMTWAKNVNKIAAPPALERWNSYSRVAVSDEYVASPLGWGIVVKQPVKVRQRDMNIDSSALTALSHFNGDVETIGYLKDDAVNIGYHVRPIQSVAVIGVGGGRDILSGLAFGATRIQGIEMNAAIIDMLTNTFGDFTGHLDKYPGVSLANAEARSYLNSHPDTYDLIQISLIDTWAATVSGGLTLSENKLYTTDAWNDFLDRLNDNGLLMVSRWNPEFNRAVSMASATLKLRDPNIDPRAHIMAAGTPQGVVTLLISKSPFTEKEIAAFLDTCKKLRFAPLLTPARANNITTARLASGKTGRAFFDKLSYDLSPPTDDRPFFFNMARPSQFIRNGSFMNSVDMRNIGDNHRNNYVASIMLTRVMIITFIASLFYIAWPLARMHKTHSAQLQGVAPYMAYFGCIGLGFILIEVAQMQRLMIFLGHPVYGLSVVLFTLLLSSGIGSYLQGAWRVFRTDGWHAPLALCLVLALTGAATQPLMEYFKYHDINTRILFSALMLIPMGLFMGMMFPLGVSMVGKSRDALLPWFWGINGTASVFASVLAVILSLEWGIRATFWTGCVSYALCLPCIWAIARKK